MKRTVSISLALAALGLAGCAGGHSASSPHRLSGADQGAFNAAAANLAEQCVAVSDEETMSTDVTKLIALYKRSDPNLPFRAPSGATLTIREALDNLIAGLQGCDPTLGERLQQQTQ